METKTQCTKCNKWFKYDLAFYGKQGEDTYDFQLCNGCENKLWNGGFLPDKANFNWQEKDE